MSKAGSFLDRTCILDLSSNGKVKVQEQRRVDSRPSGVIKRKSIVFVTLLFGDPLPDLAELQQGQLLPKPPRSVRNESDS